MDTREFPEWSPTGEMEPFPKWSPVVAPLPTAPASVGTITKATPSSNIMSGIGLGVDLLATGYNMYANEKARRAQARAVRNEIARQEKIRAADLADANNWKQIQFAMEKEDRQLSREQYEELKQIEYMQRFMNNVVNVANTDAQLRKFLMDRITA